MFKNIPTIFKIISQNYFGEEFEVGPERNDVKYQNENWCYLHNYAIS